MTAVITNENISAGPAPGRKASPAAAVPMVAKMPAPMMPPIPNRMSWTGPRDRRIWYSGFSESAKMPARVLMVKRLFQFKVGVGVGSAI